MIKCMNYINSIMVVFPLLMLSCLDMPNLQDVHRIEGRLYYDFEQDFKFKTKDFTIINETIIADISRLLIDATEFPRGKRIVHSTAKLDFYFFNYDENMVYCPRVHISSNQGTIVSGMSCGRPSISLGNLKSTELGEYLTDYFAKEFSIVIE